MDTVTIGFVFLLIALLAVLYMAMTIVPSVRTVGTKGLPGMNMGEDQVSSEAADAENAEWLRQFKTLTKIKIYSPNFPSADEMLSPNAQPTSRTSSWPVIKGYKDASGNWI